MQEELIWKSWGKTLWNEQESQGDNEGETWKEKALSNFKVMVGCVSGWLGEGGA